MLKTFKLRRRWDKVCFVKAAFKVWDTTMEWPIFFYLKDGIHLKAENLQDF